MRPIYNNFLIKRIINDNPLNLIGLDGTPLVINTRFDPLAHSSQFGEIVATPIELDSKYEILKYLLEGDVLFFHYLVCKEDRKVVINDEDYYFCNPEMIWAQVLQDKLYPLRDIVLAEIINDDITEVGGVIISLYGKRELYKLKVHTINTNTKKLGVLENDTLLVLKGAGMPIPNSDLVFIKHSNILGVERNGEIISLKGKHLILEDELTDFAIWKGLIVTDAYREKFQTGTYINGERKELKGKKVTFIHGFSTRLEIGDKKYASVSDADLIFAN